MNRRVLTAVTLTAVTLAGAIASGCGSMVDHAENMPAGGNATTMDQMDSGGGHMSDPMFTAEMIPHHQAAIDMAALARTRAEHPQIKALAAEIASAQKSEIALMKKVGKENGWDPNAKMNHSDGDAMSDHEMGMDMDVSELKAANPFDKTFIEMMVPHHEGAIRMASHELSRGSNPEIRSLAKRIIASQTEQIKQMREWYSSWYGKTLG